jgi:hypothetical protein
MTTEAAPRKCFKCGFETTSAIRRCPKCNRGLRTSRQVRLSGIALVVIGAGLSAGMAYLIWVIANIPYGLGVADLLWSVPFLIAGSIWLNKRRLVGWLTAQMANALWWYSFTFILIRELSAQKIRPGTMLFLPFALFAIWSASYLWKTRSAFWKTAVNAA